MKVDTVRHWDFLQLHTGRSSRAWVQALTVQLVKGIELGIQCAYYLMVSTSLISLVFINVKLYFARQCTHTNLFQSIMETQGGNDSCRCAVYEAPWHQGFVHIEENTSQPGQMAEL